MNDQVGGTVSYMFLSVVRKYSFADETSQDDKTGEGERKRREEKRSEEERR